jgi:hypothetical protein
MGGLKTAGSILALTACFAIGNARAADPSDKPNILFIMGDDIGIMNVGAYHQQRFSRVLNRHNDIRTPGWLGVSRIEG